MRHILLRLAVQAVHEVGVEDLADEVERVALDVDEREEQVDHLLRRELEELVLQYVLEDLEELIETKVRSVTDQF